MQDNEKSFTKLPTKCIKGSFRIIQNKVTRGRKRKSKITNKVSKKKQTIKVTKNYNTEKSFSLEIKKNN